jgi:hypothetical protein
MDMKKSARITLGIAGALIGLAVFYLVAKKLGWIKGEDKAGAVGRISTAKAIFGRPCYCKNPVTGENQFMGYISQRKCRRLCSNPYISKN